jgi:hypothetical protein
MSEETYQTWVERVLGGRDAKPLNAGEVVKAAAGQAFGTIEFIKVQKTNFLAEVGRKGDYFIFHFYPSQKVLDKGALVGMFFAPMTEAFVDVYKTPDQIEDGGWAEELNSWAIRVRGWGDNIWADELALRVIDVFDQKLEEKLKEY